MKPPFHMKRRAAPPDPYHPTNHVGDPIDIPEPVDKGDHYDLEPCHEEIYRHYPRWRTVPVVYAYVHSQDFHDRRRAEQYRLWCGEQLELRYDIHGRVHPGSALFDIERVVVCNGTGCLTKNEIRVGRSPGGLHCFGYTYSTHSGGGGGGPRPRSSKAYKTRRACIEAGAKWFRNKFDGLEDRYRGRDGEARFMKAKRAVERGLGDVLQREIQHSLF